MKSQKITMMSEIVSTLSEDFFKAVEKKYSLSIISAPKVGKTFYISYILQNAESINSSYKKIMDETVFLWIKLDKLSRDITDSVVDELNSYLNEKIRSDAGWSEIEESLRVLMENKKRLIFIVDDAHLLYQSHLETSKKLQKLNRSFQDKSSFIFLVGEELDKDSELNQILGDMYYLLYSEKTYISISDKNELEKIIKITIIDTNDDLEQEQINKIIKFSGGHPGLMRIILRHFQKNDKLPSRKELIENIETIYLFQKIWSSLLEQTQESVKKDKKYVNEYLLEAGLKNDKGKWFCELFEDFVNNIDDYVNDTEMINPETILTWQELCVYRLLKQNKDSVVSREDIAKEMWEKDWAENYSEWMIEKVISNIRKKLSNKESERIKTVPKKGYVYE